MADTITYTPALSDSDISAARAVWEDVFVKEKGETRPEKPWGSELGAEIFLALQAQVPVAAAQLTPAETNVVLLEHVAVLPAFRGRQVGSGLIEAMVEVARSQRISQIQLSARTDAQRFYQKLGFRAIGEEFEAFGSPHILMERKLTK